MPTLTVLPANLSAEVQAGELLLKAGEQAGVHMEGGCFNCFCGTCLVEVVHGLENLTPPTEDELEVLDEWHREPDRFRLSCCVRIRGPGPVVIRTGAAA